MGWHHETKHLPPTGCPWRWTPSASAQHLPGQHPPHQANAVGALVVAGHGDVDELGRRVDIAQSHDGDVGIGGFSHWLVVSPSDGEKSRVEGNRKETRVVEMFSIMQNLGSQIRSSLGSLKAAWIWLVKAPGVKRPAIEEQPTYL